MAAIPPVDVVARTAMFPIHTGHISQAFAFLLAGLFVVAK
jgi:hypothetical protein